MRCGSAGGNSRIRASHVDNSIVFGTTFSYGEKELPTNRINTFAEAIENLRVCVMF